MPGTKSGQQQKNGSYFTIDNEIFTRRNDDN